MNLRELREECWDDARELKGEDKLWPVEEMNRLINRIYFLIAAETRCIRDARTPSCCLLAVEPVDYTTYVEGSLDYVWANDASSPLYHLDVAPYVFELHESVIHVDSAKLVSSGFLLHKVSSTKWQDNPLWEQVLGTPTEYALDLQNGAIALNYRMTSSDNLQLSVRRLPLQHLVDDDDVPEFRQDYHHRIRNGVLSLMYGKKDAETFDVDKRLRYWTAFRNDIEEIKLAEYRYEERLRPNTSMRAFR